MQLRDATVLVLEDGDEYLDNLSRFVPGPRYVQAHDGGSALALLQAGPVHLVYLDMRFDRIARDRLLGDIDAATRDHGGDVERAWRSLANHQGLYLLAALREAGWATLPVLLAYDFSREPARVAFLQKQHPALAWLPDAVTPDEIRLRIGSLLARGG